MKRQKHTIFFDGDCNLCNRSVRFIIRHDKKDKFRFASLQSSYARKISESVDFPKSDTIVLLTGKSICIKSTAIIKIAMNLGLIFYLAAILFVVPVILRDIIYDLVAVSRIRIFGRDNKCLFPSEEINRKFFS